nr:MAG TPA: integrase [Caudoviricetes sp.]
MNQYLIYLRKSRADAEAEARGEGETLARHEKALLDLAKRMNLTIGGIYKEIVSGETISARPMVQKLLEEVEQGMWKGVLVMEIERLARGSTIDQGIIAQAFSFSGTKIITPLKTYDPNNEYDEEYFEFGLFMSRREYKTINRRIQRGRLASIQEGKYISSVPPYGYERIKIENNKGYTLTPHKEQADVVKMIYSLYTKGRLQPNGKYRLLGASAIARYLDSLGIKPQKSKVWSPASITDILKNPVYIGKICWQKRKEVSIIENGEKKVTRPNAKEYIMVDGLHEPLIDAKTFELAQKIMGTRAPVKCEVILKNPLAGLMYCKKCGTLMTRYGENTKNKTATLKCPNVYCDNISAPLTLIESQLLIALKEWLETYKVNSSALSNIECSNETLTENTHKNVLKELEKLEEQKNKIYTLLEQGVYSTEEFINRQSAVSKQIDILKKQLESLENEIQENERKNNIYNDIIPKTERLLNVYSTLTDATEKNTLLKEVIDKVYYIKTKRNKKGQGDTPNFSLELFPKLPK